MEKPAETRYEILDVLRRRWSPRAFADRPVEREKLRRLFEAARWSASSFNEQPWRFVVATRDDPELHQRLLGCLVDVNQRWASSAPVLMLSAVKHNFTRGGKPNRVALHDVGLAVGNLVVQATALDLFVHQMAGIDLEACRREFDIPAGFDPVAAIALGYAGDPDSLPGDLQAKENEPRSRKPFEEFVFGRSWGEPSSLIEVGINR